jgi:TPR repeat protein
VFLSLPDLWNSPVRPGRVPVAVIVLSFGLFLTAQTAEPSNGSQPPQEQPLAGRLSANEFSQLRDKAQKGDASAQLALGKAYEYGNGAPKSEESAVKWYRKAADQKNSEAETRLGVMYRLGLGVNQDKEEAVRWFHKAAKLGNSQAMFNLGVSYYNGDGISSNSSSAYAWFLLAQEAGNSAATDAVERSAEEGGRMGTPDALLLIAAMYEKGDELPQSFAEAAKWYSKAANLSPQAEFNLASMFIDGRGVPRDYGQAMTLCRNAAKQNYEPAQFCIGYLYQHGFGTPADSKEAAKWYELSRRYVPAMMALAEMYWKAEGVKLDRPEAYYYFFLANRKGASEAKTQAQTLWKEMSKDDVKHLEKKLRDLHYDPQTVFASMQSSMASDGVKGSTTP